ncbi:MAG: hypothetical protein GY910_27190 [bacterium]|nr:hypothetical protein [bacterium]
MQIDKAYPVNIRTRIGRGVRKEDMRMKMDRRNSCLALTALMLVLSLAAGSAAQGRRAAASHTNLPQEYVSAVDTQAGTIVLGPETFSVNDRSRLFDAEGRRIRLSELRAGTTGDEADMVEFLATRGHEAGRRSIRRLQVIAGDFE